MSSFCWKVKALCSTGAIAKGMEVEVIKHNTTGEPSQNEIRDAFSAKYNIKVPTAIYANKSMFQIIKP